MTSPILYEDNHLLIINKQPGEIVQGDKTGDEPMAEVLKTYIKAKYHKPGEVFLGVVHRLDRPVSGAVIFARTSKAMARMNELLKNREIRKVYWAIVGSSQFPVRSSQFAVGSSQFAIRSSQFAINTKKRETGTGNWGLGTANCRLEPSYPLSQKKRAAE